MITLQYRDQSLKRTVIHLQFTSWPELYGKGLRGPGGDGRGGGVPLCSRDGGSCWSPEPLLPRRWSSGAERARGVPERGGEGLIWDPHPALSVPSPQGSAGQQGEPAALHPGRARPLPAPAPAAHPHRGALQVSGAAGSARFGGLRVGSLWCRPALVLSGRSSVSPQLRRGPHRRVLPAVRGRAGGGGGERHPRAGAAGEAHEAAAQTHAAGEGTGAPGLRGGSCPAAALTALPPPPSSAAAPEVLLRGRPAARRAAAAPPRGGRSARPQSQQRVPEGGCGGCGWGGRWGAQRRG